MYTVCIMCNVEMHAHSNYSKNTSLSGALSKHHHHTTFPLPLRNKKILIRDILLQKAFLYRHITFARLLNGKYHHNI